MTTTTTTSSVSAAKADVKHDAERLKADGSALIDDLKGHAEDFGEAQKGEFADRVGGIAEALRDTSKKLRKQEEGTVAGLTDTAERKVLRWAKVLEVCCRGRPSSGADGAPWHRDAHPWP